MKKVLAVALAALMIFSLSACSNPASETEVATPTEAVVLPTVEINSDGNVAYKIDKEMGTQELTFVFNKNTLETVTGVFTCKNEDLFSTIVTSLQDKQNYFTTFNPDYEKFTIDVEYSKNGMAAASFIDKSPEELVTFLKGFTDGTAFGHSVEDANMIAAGYTPAPKQ